MREYRGQRADNGEWVIGYYVQKQDPLLEGVTYHYILTQEKDNCGCLMSTVSWYKVIPETVGQYTGLTDKYDKKIFDGDILEFSDRFVIVFWHVHLGCWDSRFLKFTNKENGRDDMSPLNWDYKSKVIGNIHDNPELLKGGAEG